METQYELYKNMRFVMFGTKDEIMKYARLDDEGFTKALENDTTHKELKGWDIRENKYGSYMLDKPCTSVFSNKELPDFKKEWIETCEGIKKLAAKKHKRDAETKRRENLHSLILWKSDKKPEPEPKAEEIKTFGQLLNKIIDDKTNKSKNPDLVQRQYKPIVELTEEYHEEPLGDGFVDMCAAILEDNADVIISTRQKLILAINAMLKTAYSNWMVDFPESAVYGIFGLNEYVKRKNVVLK